MDIKIATETAAKYLKEFFPDADRIMLEEVEITDDNKYWMITLSFDGSDTSTGYISLGPKRIFRVFKIDSISGQVRAMKMRDTK